MPQLSSAFGVLISTMARRAVFAAAVLSFAMPALTQQPVYPNYPPPPPPSGQNAPHTQPPDQIDQQGYPQQDQQQPDQQGSANQAPQKPSPYPQSNDQQGEPYGQQPAPQSGPVQSYPHQAAPAYPQYGNSLGWVPKGVEALGRTAAFHTDFTFDRSMLQLASGLWEGPGDPAFSDAVNRL